MRMDGKVALVTGAGQGIGRATTIRLAREGAKVLATDLNADAAATTASLAGKESASCGHDVRDKAAWEAVTRLAVERFGRLDILCNIAGYNVTGSIEQIAEKDWADMVAVNLTGTLLGCQVGLAAIVESGGAGAIINMSSLAGIVGPADLAGYAATKGGVTLLTKSVALQCAARGYPVRCVSIHPTYVDTPILDDAAAAAGSRAALLEMMGKLVPIGRICTVDDIANAILFAASDEAAMITGTGMIIDGGQTAGPPAAHSG